MSFRRLIRAGLIVLGAQFGCNKPPKSTANVVNPEHILKVSKFRSCCGHNYSTEGARSMKHYFNARPNFANANNELAVYAPFDGSVVSLEEENQRLDCFGGVKRGLTVRIASKENPNYYVRLFHINPTIDLGDVNAGDVVGYADLRQCKEKQSNEVASFTGPFDVSVEGPTNDMISIFEEFDSQVMDEWGARGLTRENIYISKATRDENPCSFTADRCALDTLCLNGETCPLQSDD